MCVAMLLNLCLLISGVWPFRYTGCTAPQPWIHWSCSQPDPQLPESPLDFASGKKEETMVIEQLG